MRRAMILTVLFFVCARTFAQAPTATNADVTKRADSYLGKMSLEEKIDYIGGTGFAVRGVPSVGLPSLEMSDGPFGVRSNQRFPSTTYAIGIGLAAAGFLNPLLAAFIHVASELTFILNSTRLLPPREKKAVSSSMAVSVAV